MVLDEAYAEYVTDSDYQDAESLIQTYDHVIVLRTFSKIYGLAGLRVGYGMANQALIQSLKTVRQPFNVNAIAIEAAAQALENTDFVDRSLRINQAGKQFFYEQLDQLGLSFYPTQANFVFMYLPISGEHCTQELIQKGIVVRNMKSFGVDNAIRVTIGTQEQNQLFFQALKEVLEDA